uniref:UPF0481 protein At3g47200 n=1 Tax=Anthurium amnicola TaxID=1678845 RepID=A0A1D1ZHM7_9ARAE
MENPQVERPAHAAVDVDNLVSFLEGILQQEESRRASPPTIHRVRPSVREEDPRAYDPKILSLGPFHRGRDGMEEMDKLKRRFMNDLLRRSPHLHSVKRYVDAVVGCSEEASAMYGGRLDRQHHLFADGFVETMVLDGCFLLELLVKSGLGELGTALAAANANTTLVRNDCLLVENQIPFCVVEALFHESCVDWSSLGEHRSPPSLRELATHFLKIKKPPVQPAAAPQVYHLLHLYHSSLDPARWPDSPAKSFRQRVARNLSKLNLVSPIFYGVLYWVFMCKWPSLSPSDSGKCPRMVPCATELMEAGIHIKKRHFQKKGEECFLRVSFEEGTLEVPFLSVEESTNSKFRNLVAFEQCCPQVGNYFTSYAVFMDNIINTAADVAVLRSCGVMESKLGSDKEVAHMFNTVCKGAHLNYDKHYLAQVFKGVKQYCVASRHRWRAKLVHEYFSSPWSLISVVVASLLLIFTGMQAVYAMVAYYRPPK